MNLDQDPVRTAYRPWRGLLLPWAHGVLIWRLARRDIETRYRGSFLGFGWAAVVPLARLAIFSLIFGGIFATRWPGQHTESTAVTTLYIFSGMILFDFFSDQVARAPKLLLNNVAYIKKVVFPLEILPWVSLIGALHTFITSFVIFLVAYAFIIGLPPWTIVTLPVLLVPVAAIALGASWILASLGIFLRDLDQLVALVTTILMFLAPIFFPRTAVPQSYQWLLAINPLTLPIELSKDILFQGTVTRLAEFTAYLAAAVAFALLGFFFFMRSRRAFADVV